ncbi:MAG: putative teichuronic acid biosynthesis glycosyltransferase TuaG [bacterium ADurb.Bin363]|nr:MAG: putative teichuronic acid biosynthesis glycosyltransferase TuaG [bacterium ADurb.Bin363]
MIDKYFPLISVIMLNYNGLAYIKRTIPPLLELDYPDYEIIIVDNGSVDGSLEYIQKFDRVKLLKSPRIRAKNFACNYGVKEAQGDFILLLDNDMLIIEKEILLDLYTMLEELENVGCISLANYNEGERKTKNYKLKLGYYFIKSLKKIDIEEVKKFHGSLTAYPEGKGLFIEKKKWEEVGGYDDHLLFGGDDNDLGIKLWMMGYKCYLYSKTLQIHTGMAEREDVKKYTIKWKEMFYAHLYTVTKNYSFFNMLITLWGLSIYGFIKSVYFALKMRHSGPFLSFFSGYYLFFKNLSVALEKRKDIQKRRKIKEDIFLYIE